MISIVLIHQLCNVFCLNQFHDRELHKAKCRFLLTFSVLESMLDRNVGHPVMLQ